MPHFIKFLVWVIFTTGITLYELLKRVVSYYYDSNLPAYLIRKSEMVAVIVCWPLDAFVLLAIVVLFLKCFIHIWSGKTQIETWEMERIESQFHTERLWMKIRNNYRLVHGKDMPKLTSWNLTTNQYEELLEMEELAQTEDNIQSEASLDPDGVVPLAFTPDDLVFPYDLGPWQNIINALGNPLTWLLPWGWAKGNGYEYITSDDDDQLGLPWPPDGGNVEFEARELSDEELRQMDIRLIRKHLDPRSSMSRSEWINDMGETLNDYGVDVDAEEEGGLAE